MVIDDCSTPAMGPWPHGLVSVARTSLNGTSYLVGITTNAVAAVATTGDGAASALLLDGHLPYPTLKFFAVPATSSTTTVRGVAADGSVVFEVPVPA
jgi:hypothetical protein